MVRKETMEEMGIQSDEGNDLNELKNFSFIVVFCSGRYLAAAEEAEDGQQINLNSATLRDAKALQDIMTVEREERGSRRCQSTSRGAQEEKSESTTFTLSFVLLLSFCFFSVLFFEWAAENRK